VERKDLDYEKTLQGIIKTLDYESIVSAMIMDFNGEIFNYSDKELKNKLKEYKYLADNVASIENKELKDLIWFSHFFSNLNTINMNMFDVYCECLINQLHKLKKDKKYVQFLKRWKKESRLVELIKNTVIDVDNDLIIYNKTIA